MGISPHPFRGGHHRGRVDRRVGQRGLRASAAASKSWRIDTAGAAVVRPCPVGRPFRASSRVSAPTGPRQSGLPRPEPTAWDRHGHALKRFPFGAGSAVTISNSKLRCFSPHLFSSGEQAAKSAEANAKLPGCRALAQRVHTFFPQVLATRWAAPRRSGYAALGSPNVAPRPAIHRR